VAGDLTDDVEQRARHLCAGWGCGTPAVGRTPAHDALAERVATMQGLTKPPTGCPFAPLYHSAPPLVIRASRALARMEQGADLRSALNGRVTAVDMPALDLIRRGQNARQASDDAVRAKEEKARKLAQEAAKP